MLVPRLEMLIPMNFFLSEDWQLNFGVDSKTAIGRVVELNSEWAIEVVNNGELKLSDVLHDFKGIYSEDEHFVPRISTEVSDDYTLKYLRVNGYTNIQTYRLCVWLDNSVNYHNKGLFDYFFDLVRDGEFEESDYEVIDWNEVVERYSNEQRSHYLGSITRS